MIAILRSDDVPVATLAKLRTWFAAEWGPVDWSAGDPRESGVPQPIVAVDAQNSLLGGLSFTQFVTPDNTRQGIWINSVLVAPEHRHRGIASKLIKAAETEAQQHALTELFVLTEFPSLYKKLEWAVVKPTDAADEFILHKKIRPRQP